MADSTVPQSSLIIPTTTDRFELRGINHRNLIPCNTSTIMQPSYQLSEEYRFRFINCWRREESFHSIRAQIDGDKWLIALNEFNTKIIPLAALDNDVHTNGRTAVITPKGTWKLGILPHDKDIVTVKARINGRDLTVIAIYIPPCINVQKFKAIVETIHAIIYSERNREYIIMGDLNVETRLWAFTNDRVKTNANLIESTFTHCGLVSVFNPHFNPPTRVTNTSSRRIDVALVSRSLTREITKPKIMENPFSDHRTLAFSLKWKPINFFYSKLDNRCYNKLIEDQDFSFLTILPQDMATADNQAEKLLKIIKELYNRAVKQIKFRRSILSLRARNLIRQIRRRKSTLMKRLENSEERKTMKREAKSLIKAIRGIEYGTWKNRKTKHRRQLIKTSQHWTIIKGTLGTTLKDISSYDRSVNKNDELFKANVLSLVNQFHDSPPSRSRYEPLQKYNHPLITEDEFKRLTRLSTSKMCKIEEWLHSASVKPIIELHRRTFQNWIVHLANCAYVPTQIKVSRVTFIEKSDRNKARPLSIMNPIYRLIDKIIESRIKRCNLDHPSLSHQHGFMENRSSLTLLMELKKHMVNIKNLNHTGYIISIDISGAFDNVPPIAILRGLNIIEADDNTMEYVHRYLIDRYSFHDDGTTRKWIKHKIGVPQGSFTGPLLYGIATAALGNLTESGTKILSYADDVYLILSTPEPNIATFAHPWSEIKRKIRTMGLELNSAKTRAIPINQPGIKRRNNLIIGSDTIPLSKEMIILGHPLRYINKRNIILIRESLVESCQSAVDRIGPFIPKITSLPWHTQRILINALVGGRINYYYPAILLWNQPSDLPREERIIGEIGSMIKKLCDWKTSLSNKVAYHLAISLPPTISAKFILSERVSSSNHTTPDPDLLPECITRPLLTNSITWTYLWPRYFPPYPHLDINITKNATEFIRYSRCRNEQRFTIRVWTVGGDVGTNPLEYTYWTHGASYLDLTTDAISDYINRPRNNILNILIIEADLGLIARLSKPCHKNPLTDTILNRNLKLELIPKTEKTTPTPYTSPTSARCPRFSKQENTITKLHYCEGLYNQNNLALKILAATDFTISQNPKFNKRHIIALTHLAGAWREKNKTFTAECQSCNETINTYHLLTGCSNSMNHQSDADSLDKLTKYPTLKSVLYHGFKIKREYRQLTTRGSNN